MGESRIKRLSCVLTVFVMLFTMLAFQQKVSADWQFDGLFSYTVNADGTCNLVYFDGESAGAELRDLVIPAKLGGHKVISIAEGAFYGLNIFTSVTIPEGVVSIGSEAFYANTKCTSISLPSTLKRIEARAFMANSLLPEVRLPKGLLYVGSRAFYSASGNLHVYVYSTTSYEVDAFLNAKVTVIKDDDPTPSPTKKVTITPTKKATPVPTLKLNYTSKTLHINQKFQFSVTGTLDQPITWWVGNTSVASVDQNGKVTGKSAANTYLYAKRADGSVAKCLLKIIDPGTLGINYTEKTIYKGNTFTFTAKNVGILNPTWSTGNTAVAKVDSNGKVTTVGLGNTYLYVKTADGRTAKCLIKVVTFNITYTEKTIKVGQTFQFTANYTQGQSVTWRVGNTAIATVDSNGKVKGKKAGNTWLYCKTSDGREVKCLLKIVSP